MNSRDRRALVMGALVVSSAVVTLRAVPWATTRLFAAHADLRERTTMLARAQDELATAETLRDSAEALTRSLVGLAPKLLSGATAAEAGADLSGRVNHAASRAPAKLDRLDQLPDSATAGRLRRIAVRASLETDVRGLGAFLHAIELGDGALLVSEMRVVATDPGSADRQPEVLRIEVTVQGWFLERRGSGIGARGS